MSKKSKKKKQPPPQHRKRFLTTRQWTIVGVLVAAVAVVAGILDPSLLQRFYWVKRPDVTMVLRASTVPERDESGTRATFDVVAENRGNKAVDYFYWHLLVPFDAVESAEFRHATNNALATPTKERFADKAQTLVLHFQGLLDKPLPAIGLSFGRLSLHTRPKAGTVLVGWQILCCDDMIFPGPYPNVPTVNGITVAKFGWFKIQPDTLRRWDIINTLPLPTEKEIADSFMKMLPT